jgi:Rad3-related DNA helicase
MERRKQISLRRARGRQQANEERHHAEDQCGGTEGERIGGSDLEQLTGERPANEDRDDDAESDADADHVAILPS